MEGSPRFLSIGLVALAAVLGGCCCADAVDQMEQEVVAIEAERAASMGSWTEAARQRGEVYGRLGVQLDPDAVGGTVACPDDSIAEALVDTVGKHTLITVDLDRLPGRSSTDGDAWAWLDHDYAADLDTLADQPGGSFDDRVFEHAGRRENRYLAVFITDGPRAMPSNFDPALFRGNDFDGGSFSGSIVVVDLDADGAVLCHAPFAARSGDTVQVAGGKDAKRSIEREFKDNLEIAVNDALDGISDHLRVNLVGLL